MSTTQAFPIHKEWYSAVLEQLKTRTGPALFDAKPEPWFPGSSERSIEVPWSLSRYRGQRRVLEVGLSLADMTLVSAQLDLHQFSGCELQALDIVPLDRVLNRFTGMPLDVRKVYQFTQGDARQNPLPSNSVDLIFIISTIEHMGFDEFEPDQNADTVFKRPREFPEVIPPYEKCRDDRKVLSELKRILVPSGRLLLTVPMGSIGIGATKDSKDRWWLYKEYNAKEWGNLLRDSGMNIIEQRFFRDDGPRGWVEEKSADLVDQKTGHLQPQAYGVACVELEK
jgi:SAM-dependent methyltransferase